MSARGMYRSYTTKFKHEVVIRSTPLTINSKLAVSKKFGIHRKLVQTWCKQENALLAISSSRWRLLGGGMKAIYRDIDKQLSRWLLEQRESGHRVSGNCTVTL